MPWRHLGGPILQKDSSEKKECSPHLFGQTFLCVFWDFYEQEKSPHTKLHHLCFTGTRFPPGWIFVRVNTIQLTWRRSNRIETLSQWSVSNAVYSVWAFFLVQNRWHSAWHQYLDVYGTHSSSSSETSTVVTVIIVCKMLCLKISLSEC